MLGIVKIHTSYSPLMHKITLEITIGIQIQCIKVSLLLLYSFKCVASGPKRDMLI